MLLDLINLDKLRRALAYILMILVLLVIQNMIISRLSFFGVRALFIPAMIAAIGMFEGGIWGGFLGLFAGIICDMGFSENTVLFAVLFAVIGAVTGFLSESIINRRFFSFVFICLASLLLTAICQAFKVLVFADAGFFPVLKTVILQTLWSMPFALPLYLPCKALSARSLS